MVSLRLMGSSLFCAWLLTACGFHLRGPVALPMSMQHIYLRIQAGALKRRLMRSLRASGVVLADSAAPNIAELQVLTAHFNTGVLTINGAARATEYRIHYRVQFNVKDGSGKILLPVQSIELSREFSYNAGDAVGSTAQVEQLRQNLVDAMTRAILLRLHAVSVQHH